VGLISGVLLLPLAPVRGVEWVAGRLLDAAEQEWSDPSAVRARLAALNRALEEGTVSEEDFEREEERLLDLVEQEHPLGASRDVRGTPPTRRSHEEEEDDDDQR
jgi:gas vesicle protein GvpG